MREVLLLLSIVGPVVGGILAWIAPDKVRSTLVLLSALMTLVAGVWLSTLGSFTLTLPSTFAPLATGLEVAVILVVLGLAIKLRSWLVGLFSLLQLALAGWTLVHPHSDSTHLTLTKTAAAEGLIPALPGQLLGDVLALILVLIVSVIGSLIVIYAIGYMKNHEHHAPATAASTGRFFFFLVAFLGFMNGLALANDITWLSLFWEATTLCSFFLIGHDGTPEARKNAHRALVINAGGGAAMMLAGVAASWVGCGETLSDIIRQMPLLPLAFLCLAAFTKSAQMPFQSWLLGAMVAPTPVSALLHSSTMVKAGSYLILRLSPAFGPTKLAPIIAIAGAFTFAVTAAIAISQSNGKKVLAYSTIGNLGLIAACAALNTPLAYAAALMILCFHAISKALLFLCMGSIEQTIGSRQIEDMGGILHRMPITTTCMVIGMVSMMAPPFGMLFAKWMAVEAAVSSPIVLLLLVIGSALSVFFWAKWIGRVVTASYHEDYQVEKIAFSMISVPALIGVAVAVTGLVAMPMFRFVFKPMAIELFKGRAAVAQWNMLGAVDAFMVWPLLAFLVAVCVAVLLTLITFKKTQIRLPFLCGENTTDGDRTYQFTSLMDKPDYANVSSYYYTPIFGEETMGLWATPTAALILMTLFGVICI